MIFDDSAFRENAILGALGVNKTGKSSTLKKIALAWRRSRPATQKIYGYDPQNVFNGLILKENMLDPDNKSWALDCHKLRDCLIVLMEVKDLCPTPQHPPVGLEKLLRMAYHWNIDIMWEAHNPTLVPETFISYTTLYYLFLIMTRDGQFKKKLPNATLCTVASNLVNRYVSKHGKGCHPLKKEYNGQGFPHAIVDCINQKVTAINMNKPF